MNPEHPTMRGCGQNTDVFWQLTERSAPFFRAVPAQCQAMMDRFAEVRARPAPPSPGATSCAPRCVAGS